MSEIWQRCLHQIVQKLLTPTRSKYNCWPLSAQGASVNRLTSQVMRDVSEKRDSQAPHFSELFCRHNMTLQVTSVYLRRLLSNTDYGHHQSICLSCSQVCAGNEMKGIPSNWHLLD
jgi:hypothetical protein